MVILFGAGALALAAGRKWARARLAHHTA